MFHFLIKKNLLKQKMNLAQDQQALEILQDCLLKKETCNANLKAISAQEKAALTFYKKKMQVDGVSCIPIDPTHFLVLEKKPTKPKLTPEVVGSLLQLFTKRKGNEWNQSDIREFCQYIEISLTQMASISETVTITDKKPLKAFLQQLH